MSNFEGILTFFYCLAGEADKAWFEQIPRLRFAALGMTVVLSGEREGETDKAWFEQIPRLRCAALGMTDHTVHKN